ncbi:MAG: transporter [Akkermansiaceae bacterium]
MTKSSILSVATLALMPLATTAFAGDMVIIPQDSVTAPGRSLKSAIPSISNPTLHELAVPQTRLHGMMMHHKIPDKVSLGGNQVALGGDINVYALQVEFALNDRLSIIASKDGFIDFNPDNTLTDQTGFANVAAGLKYAFIYDEEKNFAASASLSFELPTGNRDVFQGRGDGAALLTFSALKLAGPWQFSAASGIHVPFDSDAESTTGFASAHVSYQINERFTPIAEVNLYHTFSEGNTGLGTDFEGGDLINFGSPNGSANETIVTAALGLRYQVCTALSLGVAYEVPLTSEEDNLMDSRITLDFVYQF